MDNFQAPQEAEDQNGRSAHQVHSGPHLKGIRCWEVGRVWSECCRQEHDGGIYFCPAVSPEPASHTQKRQYAHVSGERLLGRLRLCLLHQLPLFRAPGPQRPGDIGYKVFFPVTLAHCPGHRKISHEDSSVPPDNQNVLVSLDTQRFKLPQRKTMITEEFLHFSEVI